MWRNMLLHPMNTWNLKLNHMSIKYDSQIKSKFNSQEHLRSWLKDSQARDQFLTYRDAELSVCYNRKKETPEIVKTRTALHH